MPLVSHNSLIVITGAAGLVGQNLLILLREQGYNHLLAIDAHASNLAIAATLNPGVKTLCADLSQAGDWQQAFSGASAVIQLHAQITSLHKT